MDGNHGAETKKETKKIKECVQAEKERFRLRFSKNLELGRSNLSGPKLPEVWGTVVTPKFYSIHDNLPPEEDETVRQILEEISKARCAGPMEKYDEPILESQCYGWFPKKYLKSGMTSERAYFPKKTSEMVKIQNLLYNADKAEQLYNQTRSKEKPK